MTFDGLGGTLRIADLFRSSVPLSDNRLDIGLEVVFLANISPSPELACWVDKVLEVSLVKSLKEVF